MGGSAKEISIGDGESNRESNETATNNIRNKENEELDAVLPKKNCKMSPAQQQKAIMKGHDLDDLPCFEDDEEFDSMSIESNEEDKEGNEK